MGKGGEEENEKEEIVSEKQNSTKIDSVEM